MASQAQNGPRLRGNPFGRSNGSPSPGPPPGHARSKSAIMQPPLAAKPTTGSHARTNSLADMGMLSLLTSVKPAATSSPRQGSPAPGTFAPKFIKTELDGATDRVGGIEGENDFSGKRYVWVKDTEKAFVKGWVVEELSATLLRIQCEDGSVSIHNTATRP